MKKASDSDTDALNDVNGQGGPLDAPAKRNTRAKAESGKLTMEELDTELAKEERAWKRARKETKHVSYASDKVLEHDTAVAVGINANQLTEEEEGLLPPGTDEQLYTKVRNHILAKWRADVTRWLTEEEAGAKIDPRFRYLVAPAYRFLVAYGYINFGVAPRIAERQLGVPATKESVLVIGAGLAGLAAARQLRAFGHKVVVVEGRDRPGGRVYTKRMEADGAVAAADLGGSIITGIDGNPLALLARQLNIPMHDINTSSQGFAIYLDSGDAPDPVLDDQIYHEFNSLLDTLSKHRDDMADVSHCISLGTALDTLWGTLYPHAAAPIAPQPQLQPPHAGAAVPDAEPAGVEHAAAASGVAGLPEPQLQPATGVPLQPATGVPQPATGVPHAATTVDAEHPGVSAATVGEEPLEGASAQPTVATDAASQPGTATAPAPESAVEAIDDGGEAEPASGPPAMPQVVAPDGSACPPSTEVAPEQAGPVPPSATEQSGQPAGQPDELAAGRPDELAAGQPDELAAALGAAPPSGTRRSLSPTPPSTGMDSIEPGVEQAGAAATADAVAGAAAATAAAGGDVPQALPAAAAEQQQPPAAGSSAVPEAPAQASPAAPGARGAAPAGLATASPATGGTAGPLPAGATQHTLHPAPGPKGSSRLPTSPPSGGAPRPPVAAGDPRLMRRLYDWHVANVEFANAARAPTLSLKYWDLDDPYEFLGPHTFLPGGNLRLVAALAEQLPIMYRSTVTKVSHSASGASVQLHDGSVLKADAVLVTVPLGVLKAGAVAFDPPLPPRKQDAIRRMGFGVLNKVVMLFPYVFWDEKLDMFGRVVEDTQQRGDAYLFYSYAHISGGALLAALVAGSSAEALEHQDPGVAVERVMAWLRRVHEPRGITVPPPLQAVCTRWGADPWARGSYSSCRVGSMGADDYDTLAEAVGGRVFFAGEATIKKYPATMHGAFLSGLREAAHISAHFARLNEAKGKAGGAPGANGGNGGTEEVGEEDVAGMRRLVAVSKEVRRVFQVLEPDLELGFLAALWGPAGTAFEDDALVRIDLGSMRSSSRKDLVVFTAMGRTQVLALCDVPGGDEARLAVMTEAFSVKVLGRGELEQHTLSLVAAIAGARGLQLDEGLLSLVPNGHDHDMVAAHAEEAHLGMHDDEAAVQ